MTNRLELHGYQSLQVLRSRDLEETRKLVADVFCEHRLQAGSSEHLNYQHSYLSTGRLSFSQIRYGAEVNIQPETLDSFYLIQLPVAGHDTLRICGREQHSDHRHGSVHGPDESLEMNWSSDCRKLVVRIEREALELHASSLYGQVIQRPLRFYSGMNLDHPACAAWRNTARHIFGELQRSPQLFEMSLIRTQFEQTLMTALLSWQPHNLLDESQQMVPRVLPRHVKLAADYMQANPEDNITVECLVAISGVSGRTLFAGFAKFMGMSPMRYLRDVRLDRVHQDLLDPCKPRSVTQVATRWGFYQLGRMASDYRKRFGESPRETLARSGLKY
ncbi:AraC family transcriptional regulator [Pseudomonas sp. TTU2014-080ASC]|jgi:AraC-like DNA-binding protein|uniref:AraC family transcriptional regulator n=1 Tax=Pseudomonas sp. TTU2014-080ASC TaxID=1729724 RepID=UPI00071893B7|nr:AraC family transcriptional regulator [Pseudomonas sp. TTU2014-080ASC]KRW61074.1 AraC family transcriptional regulator [Pseudomonas sp. TTU2014-080ASC]